MNRYLMSGLVLAGSAAAAAAASAQEDRIRIDGSSTVFPITEAVAEEFQIEQRGAYRVTVGVSGTGGGFKKFCRGETDISGASRPISEGERQACADAGISYIELPIGLDALAVVVNPENDWVDHLTVEELATMWEPEAQGEITNWSQIRDSFPDRPLELFAPGVDSGTYDYFTAATVGEEGSSRGDFTASEDDNILVQGVAGDANALGFFGLAYYVENQDRLKAVPISYEGGEPVAPSQENASNGNYQPLTRPIFWYVNAEKADREAVQEFMHFALDPETVQPLIEEVGYVPLSDETFQLAMDTFENRVTGTAFEGGAQIGISASDILQMEKAD